jgi:hypothetical protein
MVMYLRSQRIRATSGRSLGQGYDPYFNRTWRHFCSHQHTPSKPEPSGFDCGVRLGPVTYLAHPMFSLYRTYGAVAYRQYLEKVLLSALDDRPSLTCTLPSTARVALNAQTAEGRYILHLLSANTISRGGSMNLSGGTVAATGLTIEVIEELLPLHRVKITLRNLPAISRVALEPQGREIPFVQSGDEVHLEVEEFICHQMLAIHKQ